MTRRLRLALLATVRPFAPLAPWPAEEPVAIVSQVDDPLRCRCPECLMLDARFPGQGWQMAFWPYRMGRRA